MVQYSKTMNPDHLKTMQDLDESISEANRRIRKQNAFLDKVNQEIEIRKMLIEKINLEYGFKRD